MQGARVWRNDLWCPLLPALLSQRPKSFHGISMSMYRVHQTPRGPHGKQGRETICEAILTTCFADMKVQINIPTDTRAMEVYLKMLYLRKQEREHLRRQAQIRTCTRCSQSEAVWEDPSAEPRGRARAGSLGMNEAGCWLVTQLPFLMSLKIVCWFVDREVVSSEHQNKKRHGPDMLCHPARVPGKGGHIWTATCGASGLQGPKPKRQRDTTQEEERIIRDK